MRRRSCCSAGTISRPFAIRNARRTRRSARSTGSRSGARATKFSSRRAPAHSCIARCARWWARWSRSAPAAGARTNSGPRSRPPTAAAAARSPRLTAFIWFGWTTRDALPGEQPVLPRECGGGGPSEGRWRGLGRPMRAPSATIANARRLRRALSPPEARLWNRLRQRAPGLPTFRRQHSDRTLCSRLLLREGATRDRGRRYEPRRRRST